MVPVNEELPVSQVGECIDGEITLSPYLKALLVLGKAWNKLTEQAYRSKNACGCSSPPGQPPDEISPGMPGLMVCVHVSEGYQQANLLSFFLNYLNPGQ